MKIDDNSAFEATRVTGPHSVARVGPVFDLFAVYGPSSPLQAVDQANLSVQGQEIQRLIQAVKELPDVREEKLKGVAERLQNGSWQVSAEDLAEAMFRLAELDQG